MIFLENQGFAVVLYIREPEREGEVSMDSLQLENDYTEDDYYNLPEGERAERAHGLSLTSYAAYA